MVFTIIIFIRARLFSDVILENPGSLYYNLVWRQVLWNNNTSWLKWIQCIVCILYPIVLRIHATYQLISYRWEKRCSSKTENTSNVGISTNTYSHRIIQKQNNSLIKVHLIQNQLWIYSLIVIVKESRRLQNYSIEIWQICSRPHNF